jgi:hypothetical protein
MRSQEEGPEDPRGSQIQAGLDGSCYPGCDDPTAPRDAARCRRRAQPGLVALADARF